MKMNIKGRIEVNRNCFSLIIFMNITTPCRRLYIRITFIMCKVTSCDVIFIILFYLIGGQYAHSLVNDIRLYS